MLRKTGIIHGDVKPQNVLIFKDDFGKYVAKVTDFDIQPSSQGAGHPDAMLYALGCT